MKKMTKKSLAIALTGAMCLALVGCGGGSKETKAETKAAETSAADETKAAEEGAGYKSVEIFSANRHKERWT